VGTAEEAGKGIDADKNEDALNGPVDDAQGQSLGVVLVPGLDIEREESYNG